MNTASLLAKRPNPETCKESGVCPNCGSDNVDFLNTELDKNNMYQYCYCNDCEEQWAEVLPSPTK